MKKTAKKVGRKRRYITKIMFRFSSSRGGHSEACFDGVKCDAEKYNLPLCPKCGFEYPATVNHRTIGKTACPKCAAQERGAAYSLNAAAQNNFALQFPLLAEEWDYERNGELKPENVSASSNKRVGWVCSFCGNRWEQSVNKRTSGHGCPNCTRTGTSFSELAFFLSEKTLPRYTP